MKKIDFGIQTLLLIGALLSLTVEKEVAIMVMLVQLLVGGWQIISAFVITLNSEHGDPVRTKMIRGYWISVAAYFFGLIVLYIAKGGILTNVWFFTAWLIAIYYYVITIKLAFGKTKNGRKTYMDVVN